MKYRQLGRTGIQVSEIGFGAWGIGGDAYGKTDDDKSRATIRKALELGVTFFDTSDLYGNGHSEELLGQVFAEEKCRDRVVIATKFGALPHTGFEMKHDMSNRHLATSLHHSLVRLQTDYIDVYQMHSPPIPRTNKEFCVLFETFDLLDKFQKTGAIKSVGISVKSPEHVKYFDETLFAADSYQFNLNLTDHRAIELGVLSRDYGKIARTPFCFGFLTGKIDNIEFRADDHRAKWSVEQKERWRSSAELFRSMAVSVDNRTLPQFALEYCLSFNISTVIPGMMRPEEVIENVQASEMIRLTESELRAIDEIYSNEEFIVKQ